jgi:hypothetical protein
MTMRSLTLAALLLAVALAAVPVAAGQAGSPQHKTDPDISSGKEQRRLSNARKLWKARGVPSYRYQLSVNCFCPPMRDIRIVVRNGRPAVYSDKELDDQATVPRLFRTIQDAIDRKAAKLDVTYGPRGVPRSIYIDRESYVADEEVGYVIRGFRPIAR